MKHQKLLVILLALIIATSTLGMSIVSAKKTQTQKDFILTATGQAYDKKQQTTVQVTLTLQGTAKTRGCTWEIAINSGQITIEGQDPIFVNKGKATLIPKHGYLSLNLYTQSQYGYRKAMWNLKGRTTETIDDQFDINIYSRRVFIPEKHYPQLINLNLDAEITFN